jgi:hypothetical protein
MVETMTTGVDASELQEFIASLEDMSHAANGYGSLVSAVIKTELADTVVIATTTDGWKWDIAFEAKPKPAPRPRKRASKAGVMVASHD